MSFLDRIRACNNCNTRRYVRLIAGGKAAGWIRDSRIARLEAFGDVFDIGPDRIVFAPEDDTVDGRTRALGEVVHELACERNGQRASFRLRDETYAVRERFADPPTLLVDRGAVPFFGFRAYGVHMNGFVRDGDRLKMWIGRRAQDKAVSPGKLDNMVAGGQPADLTLRENLIKEAAEEASIPAELASQAIPVGAISYCMESPQGLKPDVMFCYDLELPPDFEPQSSDGEHETFYLMPAEEVAETVRTTEDFKFNCNLVIIDFLIRHGLLPPEDPDYVDILKALRQ